MKAQKKTNWGNAWGTILEGWSRESQITWENSVDVSNPQGPFYSRGQSSRQRCALLCGRLGRVGTFKLSLLKHNDPSCSGWQTPGDQTIDLLFNKPSVLIVYTQNTTWASIIFLECFFYFFNRPMVFRLTFSRLNRDWLLYSTFSVGNF